jgi:hypothetical protein
VNEDALKDKVEQVKVQFVKESSELKATVKALENKLNESMKKELQLNKKLDEAKARELIARKTKDLPIVESKEMCRRLKGMGVSDIEKKFDEILEDVHEKIQDERNLGEEEKNLEEAINDIMQEKQDEGDAPEKTGEGEGNGTESNPPEQNSEGDSNSTTVDEEEETPVTESMARAYMQQWIDTLDHLTPKN